MPSADRDEHNGETSSPAPRPYTDIVPTLDEFPSTHRTFLTQALSLGDIEAARQHVMSRAYAPLCAYVGAANLRHIGTPEDLVGGFMASRFARDDYFTRWINQQPPMALRRWLVNGLLFYAHERIAEYRRARRTPNVTAFDMIVEPEPWRELERAWRRGVLQMACDRVQVAYTREGRSDFWRLFTRHVLDGVAYPALEIELAIPAASAPMITRTALRRLRAEIELIFADEFLNRAERALEVRAILFEDDEDPSASA